MDASISIHLVESVVALVCTTSVVIVLVLLDGLGPRAHLGPHPRERAVLAEAGLVLVIGHDAFAGMGLLYLRQRLGEFFFLKASSASGSVSG